MFLGTSSLHFRGKTNDPLRVEGSSSPNDSLRGRAGGLESASLTSHLRRGGAAARANAASNATMGGVSKNATASPKTKVRPLPFSRVDNPAKRVIRNPPTLRRPSSFFLAEKPRRFLTTQSAVAGGYAPARHAARDPAPSEPATKVRRASRVPPPPFPRRRVARPRRIPGTFFPPASDALPPALRKSNNEPRDRRRARAR